MFYWARRLAQHWAVPAPIWRALQLVAISLEQGAQTIIYLATSPEVEDITGKSFVKQRVVQSSQESYDLRAAQHLWQVNMELTGLSNDASKECGALPSHNRRT